MSGSCRPETRWPVPTGRAWRTSGRTDPVSRSGRASWLAGFATARRRAFSLDSRCGNPVEAGALGGQRPRPVTWANASSSPAGRKRASTRSALLDRRNLTRYSQVTRMAPPQLSGFAPGFSVASVQEDSLRLGRLPWSAARRTRRRRFSRLPGNRGFSGSSSFDAAGREIAG